MHSKAKLFLGVLTSPRAAFEEVLERKLLGTALIIVALTGVMVMISSIARATMEGPVNWFALGKDNPIAWFGLYMLYALAIVMLGKWLGTEFRYADILIVMGWAQVSLLLAQTITAVSSLLIVGGAPNNAVMSYAGPAQLVLQLAYPALCGIAISVAGRTTFFRGFLSYIAIGIAAWIGFGQTYGGARLNLFKDALPGVTELAKSVVSVDNIPWLGAAIAGLAMGIWHLAANLEWDTGRRNRLIASIVIVGIVIFCGYTYTIYKVDYYGKLLSAQSFYEREKFEEAATRLRALLPISKKDKPSVMLDIGKIYYLAAHDELALSYYKKSLAEVMRQKPLDQLMLKAEAHNGIGAVNYIRGEYPAAIVEFTKASKLWKEFREPWIRVALAYDRMGDYKNAIKSADYAINKLESEAVVGQVALIEALAQTGDAKRAKTTYTQLEKADKILAKRIGSSSADWMKATAKLTRNDLRFPLEIMLSPDPSKAQSPKKNNTSSKSTRKAGK